MEEERKEIDKMMEGMKKNGEDKKVVEANLKKLQTNLRKVK